MRRLDRLERRVRTHLQTLVRLTKKMPNVPREEADRTASFVCLEALNIWAEFTRTYFVCALANSVTSSGSIVATSFPRGISIESALRNIPIVLNRVPSGRLSRRDEPTWHSRRNFLRIAQLVGLTNLGQVQAALSLPSRVIDDLPTVRNFFAHRNQETATKVFRLSRRYGIARVNHPTELVRSVVPGRPATIIEDWLAELDHVVKNMCT